MPTPRDAFSNAGVIRHGSRIIYGEYRGTWNVTPLTGSMLRGGSFGTYAEALAAAAALESSL